MSIIKCLNRNWLTLITISLILNSCNSQKIVSTQENKKKQCVLGEMDLTEFKISSSRSYIANSEFKNDFESTNKYDVLEYSGKSGDNDYQINRWYYKSDNVFVHVIITNEVKSISEMHVKENEIRILFENLQKKSYLKVCGNCFDCGFGLLMVKNKETFFKYYYEGNFYKDLTNTDQVKIIRAINILTFLNNL